MLQELFRIPGLDLPIYGYGVMLVIGFLLGLQLAKFLARRVGLDPEKFVNAGLVALVAGVVGARISHVVENWPQYSDASRSLWANFVDAVNIRSGGLTFYGGFLFAFPITAAYALWTKIPIKRGMDVVAPGIMVALGIGRIGCLLNGCCYGAVCEANFPLAVSYPYNSTPYVEQYYDGHLTPPDELLVPLPDRRRPTLLNPADARHDPTLAQIVAQERSLPTHPAQLYSTVTALMIAGILVSYFSLNPAPGRVMALMLMLEGVSRFLLETLRSEPPVTHVFGYAWSFSMVLSVFLLIAGVITWFLFGTLARRGGRPQPVPAPAA